MKRSRVAQFLVLSILASHLLMVLLPISVDNRVDDVRALSIFIGVLAGIVILNYFTRTLQVSRALIVVSFILLFGYQALFPLSFLFELLIVTGLILQSATYQAYPSNLVSSLVAAGIAFLYRLEIAFPFAESSREMALGALSAADEHVVYLVVVVLIAVVGSLMIRYRESAVELQDEIDELRAVGARLAEANLSVQNYAQNIRESTLSQERKRLTRDIHDSVGYLITNVTMALEAIRLMASREPESIPALVDQAKEQVERGSQDTRATLRDLRKEVTELVSGVYSIARLVDTFSTATGIEVSLDYGSLRLEHDEVVQTVIYRFIQEGMINAFRHGRATRVLVQFWRSADHLNVTVWDNGESAKSVEEGIGIAGMRERLDLVRGTLRIQLVPTGFSITISIPHDQLKISDYSAAREG